MGYLMTAEKRSGYGFLAPDAPLDGKSPEIITKILNDSVAIQHFLFMLVYILARPKNTARGQNGALEH